MATKTTTQKVISPEKLKDMIESILPSKRRGRQTAYYFKRMECRKVRRKVRQYIQTCDQEGYTNKNLKLKPYQTQNVWQRRYSDKINHFERWASRLTLGMEEEEALAYIRRLLPRNLIGDHAFSHWESYVRGKYIHSAAIPRPQKRCRSAKKKAPDPALTPPKKSPTTFRAPHIVNRLAHRASRRFFIGLRAEGEG